MRTLHLACMPYPTPQGTQGVVRAMVGALRAGGRRAHLLVYGPRRSEDPSWLIRSGGPSVTERSGPSLPKILADAAMIGALRLAWRRHGRCPVVAHNVEAAWVARAAGVQPAVYFAHTRFDTELGTYGPLPAASAIGRWLDRGAAGLGPVAAISPALAEHLGGTFVAPPWPLAQRAGPAGDQVLYAGNLDGYQGWETVVRACALAKLPLTVATESDAAPLRGLASTLDLPSLRVVPLRTEADRVRAHASAFIAAVPRRAPGGLPIKLLDALARGRPVVAMERALAGLEAPPAVEVVRDDDDDAFADALVRRSSRHAGDDGREWVATHFSPDGFGARLEPVLVSAFGAQLSAS